MGKYDDILYMEHPEPRSHKRMAPEARAAQFMPFAALGSEQGRQIGEVSRITERRIELDDSERKLLDQRLAVLLQHPNANVSITYFREDLYKDGGEYLVSEGKMVKVDKYSKTIIMEDGSWIPVTEITKIEGSIYNRLENDE